MSVSRPMKLIALRMDEDDKIRLEHLAAERHLTLSAALREGARLYLGDVKGNLHRRKGEPLTWHGLRRSADGSSIEKPQPPTARQAAQVRALENALVKRGLGSIRSSWDGGASPSVIVAAIGQWLRLVGLLYTGEPTRWDLMLIDYAEGFDEDEAGDLRRDLDTALIDGVVINPSELLDVLDSAMAWLLRELHEHEMTRRAMLLNWAVFRKERAAPAKQEMSAPAFVEALAT